ncbi:uncharacterized protein LOC127858324 [Dreissena polymorpha]|uniref:Uncharacterized protein n=1 Tax=Dreissena polymorpha TaxID=45954 RepID=A0A9D3Z0A5_DREPO|nr:uncharacterized protein LOC127858324 [Dreissena polymorpha]XP_052251330.1 uncharacterized protein LOC127858324 [Dreissena polymorpha]XP_052251331.1 uncharacterized protein LOC127858324 [Dreissena polymorpha]KAH3707759.1 hypothetical protein DPMN_067173 [Dreissena polymorpha]
MKPSDYKYVFKCVIIGDCHVGKTTLLRRMLGEPFLPKPTPMRNSPISLRHLQCVDKIFTTLEGDRVKLQVYDTMGLERHRSLTLSYYRDAHCCLICYNVHNTESFDNLKTWLADVHKYLGGNTNLVKMLVGINSRAPALLVNGTIHGIDAEFVDVEPITKRPTEFAQEHDALTCEVQLFDETDVKTCFQTAVDSLVKRFQDDYARSTALDNGSVHLTADSSQRSSCC